MINIEKVRDIIRVGGGKVLIGAMLGFGVGLLPVLVLFDILKIEFFIILLAPISLISKNMLLLIFIAPIFYAALGVLIALAVNVKGRE